MTKVKAQALVSFLIGLDYTPTIKLVGPNSYSVTVTGYPGVTSNAIQAVENNQGVVASVQQVEFN